MWPAVRGPQPSGSQLQCATEQWEPLALAPVSLTHIALVLGFMIIFFERAQIRKACILFTAWCGFMAWFAFRRATAGMRQRAQAKRVKKAPFRTIALKG